MNEQDKEVLTALLAATMTDTVIYADGGFPKQILGVDISDLDLPPWPEEPFIAVVIKQAKNNAVREAVRHIAKCLDLDADTIFTRSSYMTLEKLLRTESEARTPPYS